MVSAQVCYPQVLPPDEEPLPKVKSKPSLTAVGGSGVVGSSSSAPMVMSKPSLTAVGGSGGAEGNSDKDDSESSDETEPEIATDLTQVRREAAALWHQRAAEATDPCGPAGESEEAEEPKTESEEAEEPKTESEEAEEPKTESERTVRRNDINTHIA